MSQDESLRGSCTCGRYGYIIHIPSDSDARSQAHVHFGTGHADRQSHSSILSAWLRVPLPWFQTQTYSFFPDEQDHQIAKTFTPRSRPSCQRKFCGFCGTHISYWTEEPRDEQEFMNITLGSLNERDLHALEELDLLPQDVNVSALNETVEGQSEEAQAVSAPTSDVVRHSRSGETRGFKWFEDMIEGSQLGYHSTRRKGHGQSADGTTTVSWEVSEIYGEEEQPSSSKRRKVEIEDEQMKD